MSTEVEKVGPLALALDAALASGGVALQEDDTDPALMARIIASNIASATTLEAAFANVKSTGAADVVGQPLIINSVMLKKSELPEGEGTGVYMLIDAENGETGARLLINTGSAKIMPQLAWAADHGHVPGLAVRVIELAQARRGQSAPLGLELIPGPKK